MKRLAYLNESILLEERGLPRMQMMIIITIAVIVGLFIYWSNILTIEEHIDIGGTVLVIDDQVAFRGFATASDIVLINEGDTVRIAIEGVTGRSTIEGIITMISSENYTTDSGTVYYEVFSQANSELNYHLIEGMKVKLSVKIDERSLAQYLLGSLYEAGKE